MIMTKTYIMKKFLVIISPLCVILFIFMWISWGLKDTLIFFGGAALIVSALAFGLPKWIELVDKHVD